MLFMIVAPDHQHHIYLVWGWCGFFSLLCYGLILSVRKKKGAERLIFEENVQDNSPWTHRPTLFFCILLLQTALRTTKKNKGRGGAVDQCAESDMR